MAKRRTPSATPPPAPDDTEELLGRRDAAERAGVHYNTIRLWENAGHLDPIRVTVGRRVEVRYRAEQLDAVAESQREKRNAPPPSSTALELPTDRLWEMVQEATGREAAALERAAGAEASARACQAELERAEERHAAQLARLNESKRRRQAEAEQRAADAEARAADLQAALVELAKPSGWFLFRRRPVVVVGGQRQLAPGDEVAVPAPDADDAPPTSS